MNATDKTYNGWTNYETWAWKLWMDNEEGSYRHWKDQAEEAYRDAKDGVSAYAKFTKREIFSREERAAQKLADMLKDEAEENQPEVTGPYADLMSAALSEINWNEIATSLVEEAKSAVDEEEAEEADDESDDDDEEESDAHETH